jgi:glycosyltransferase involved in cell wall biosynthesis
MADISNLTVALCVEDFPPFISGGGGRSNSTLASALALQCKQVIVFHHTKDGLKTYEMTGLHCVEVNKDAASFRNIDIIHVCGRMNPAIISTIRLTSFAPVIFTSRSNSKALDRLGSRPVVLERNRKQNDIIEIASAIVACSEAEANELRSDYSQFTDKILSIHNAIDPKLLSAIVGDHSKFITSTGPVFAFLGRFRTHKGILDLLIAAEKLWREGYDFSLKLVGGHIHHGENDINLKIINTCRLWSHCLQRIDWINDPEEVAAIYKSVHCVIIPSHYEPFGLVAIEAISAGCYVIASKAGGLNETLENVSCACTYSLKDKFALENTIRNFISDRLWEKMDTQRCAKYVQEQFTPENMVTKYLKLYARVLRKL